MRNTTEDGLRYLRYWTRLTRMKHGTLSEAMLVTAAFAYDAHLVVTYKAQRTMQRMERSGKILDLTEQKRIKHCAPSKVINGATSITCAI